MNNSQFKNPIEDAAGLYVAEQRSAAQKLLDDGAALGLTLDELAQLRHAWRLELGNKDEQRQARQIVAAVQAQVRASSSVAQENAKVLLAFAAAKKAIDAQLEGGAIDRGRYKLALREMNRAKRAQIIDDHKAGPTRIKTRDGLASLRESSRIDQVHETAGLFFREQYELSSGGLRSQLGEGGGGFSDIVATRFANAKRGVILRRLELSVMLAERAKSPAELSLLRKIAGIDRREADERMLEAYFRSPDQLAVSLALRAPNGRVLPVVRQIAGEGRSLWEVAPGGKQGQAAVGALRRGLEVIATEIGLKRA